jgi:hypothetical protein
LEKYENTMFSQAEFGDESQEAESFVFDIVIGKKQIFQCFKGTVARDFLVSAFFMDLLYIYGP